MDSLDADRVRPVRAALCIASLAVLAGCGGSVCVGFDGCGNVNGAQSVSISGTAATGRALANALVNFSCAQGSAAMASDSGGKYGMTFNATLPCIISVTSGATVLHSVAFASGTFNTTPETELTLVYLASQLGTSEGTLIAGISVNAQFQRVLSNQTDVLSAQAAVVANLQQRYSLTLSTPAFLTTPFNVGQAGVDSDLVALAAAGAIDANGMPDPAAVSLVTSSGLANPLMKAMTSSSHANGLY